MLCIFYAYKFSKIMGQSAILKYTQHEYLLDESEKQIKQLKLLNYEHIEKKLVTCINSRHYKDLYYFTKKHFDFYKQAEEISYWRALVQFEKEFSDFVLNYGELNNYEIRDDIVLIKIHGIFMKNQIPEVAKILKQKDKRGFNYNNLRYFSTSSSFSDPYHGNHTEQNSCAKIILISTIDSQYEVNFRKKVYYLWKFLIEKVKQQLNNKDVKEQEFIKKLMNYTFDEFKKEYNYFYSNSEDKEKFYYHQYGFKPSSLSFDEKHSLNFQSSNVKTGKWLMYSYTHPLGKLKYPSEKEIDLLMKHKWKKRIKELVNYYILSLKISRNCFRSVMEFL